MKSCNRCTTHSRKKGYNPVNQLVGYILSGRSYLYHDL